MSRKHRLQRGFSLVEIAIVLVIVGLLSVGMVSGYVKYRSYSLYKTSQVRLEDIRHSLLAFARVNGYLPCPDTDGDGKENRAGSCKGVDGTVPYLDIGLSRAQAEDAWRNPVGYHITRNADSAAISNPARSASYFDAAKSCQLSTPPTASTTDADNLTVKDGDGNTVIEQASLVLVARNSNGRAACNTLADDEKENCNNDKVFIQHEPTADPFFDDQVIAINGYEIKAAGACQ